MLPCSGSDWIHAKTEALKACRQSTLQNDIRRYYSRAPLWSNHFWDVILFGIWLNTRKGWSIESLSPPANNNTAVIQYCYRLTYGCIIPGRRCYLSIFGDVTLFGIWLNTRKDWSIERGLWIQLFLRG
jgi:hypothetical protein